MRLQFTLLLALCSVASVPLEAKISFQQPVTITSGQLPQTVILVDVNNDGKLDVIATDSVNNALLVMLGNGTGGFRHLPTIKSLNGPGAIASGDFDGDGNLDLAISETNPPEVVILLGKGDGTFQKPKPTQFLASSLGIAVGDFNNDQKLDLVIGTFTGITVMLGKGDGTFQSGTSYFINHSGAQPTVADFNRDGKLDLATLGGFFLVTEPFNLPSFFSAPITWLSATSTETASWMSSAQLPRLGPCRC